jgi:ADP-ribose pyrophosphatase YjhB (NUDIX family)
VIYLDPKVAVGTIIAVPGGDVAPGEVGGSDLVPADALRPAEPRPDQDAEVAAAGQGEPRVVLVRRSIEPGYGLWVFPGGYVDRGERPEDAAVREAREECGLEVRLDALINVYSYPGRTPIILAYAARAVGGSLCADDECLEARLFYLSEIPWTGLAFPSTRDALTDYLAGVRHPLR